VVSVPVGSEPFPVVVMAHGMGGLKEWTIPELAQKLGRAGFASFSFDYRNFGASSGTPREEINHPGQVEDWMNAITGAAGLPEAVGALIGLWGTSLGGRNMLAAAAQDWGRVSAVVVQVPATVPMELQPMMGTMFGGMSDVNEFLAELTADRNDRAAGLEPRYFVFDPAPEPGSAAEHAEYWATFGEAERRTGTHDSRCVPSARPLEPAHTDRPPIHSPPGPRTRRRPLNLPRDQHRRLPLPLPAYRDGPRRRHRRPYRAHHRCHHTDERGKLRTNHRLRFAR